MKKNILLLCCIGLLWWCSLPNIDNNISKSDGKVCDAQTWVCDEVANSEVFTYANLQNNTSVLNKNYPAADLIWLENWINSEWYDSLEELRWQVVLIDFWTLWCINCIRTLPHLVETYGIYHDQWFEILGLHAPEFAYEQKLEAVQRVVDTYKLPYPIAQDNDFMTWRAYKNRYWPAHYLIDKQWNVRYTHFGEWKYEEMRQAIEQLLAE